MSELTRYYLYGIVPVLIIFVIIVALLDFIAGSFFILGFIWPYSYYTPGLKEKLNSGHKKLSLLSLSVQCHDFLFNKISNEKYHFILRGVIPILFISLMSLISLQVQFLWVFVGWFSFELYFLISRPRGRE